jgi:hypothetical protein
MDEEIDMFITRCSGNIYMVTMGSHVLSSRTFKMKRSEVVKKIQTQRDFLQSSDELERLWLADYQQEYSQKTFWQKVFS